MELEWLEELDLCDKVGEGFGGKFRSAPITAGVSEEFLEAVAEPPKG